MIALTRIRKELKVSEDRRFLFCLCGDRSKASSRVRGYWVAEALASQQVRCTLRSRHSKLDLLELLWQIARHDVIFFQKVYSRYHYWLLRWATFLKKKTIVDLDDAPSRTHNSKTLQNVQRMMQMASATTVGSQALADYAVQFSKNVELVPSSIYLKYYQPTRRDNLKDDLVCLGWIGNGSHYKQDLIDTLKAPLTEIAQYLPVKLKLIGTCGESDIYDAFEGIAGLELDFVDQIEWSNTQAVATALQDIDIGLYPLLPNDFNRYKCGFKALEYMAMGIPVISSYVAENTEIIEHEVTGLFAQSKKDWVDSIAFLIGDRYVRREIGRRGRAMVNERYSVIQASHKLLSSVGEDS